MLGLSKREIEKRFDEIVEFAETAGLHRRAGEDLLLGHVHAARVRRGDPRRPRGAAGRRGARGRRRGLHAQVPRQVRRVQAARQDHPARHALAGPGRTVLRRGGLARRRPRSAPRAIPSASSARTCRDVEPGRKSSSCASARRPGAGSGRGGGRPPRRPRPRPAAPTSGRPDAGHEPTCSATEGRWGSREVEITDVGAARRDGPRRARLPVRRPRARAPAGPRAVSRSRTSCSASASSTPRASACYGTNTDIDDFGGEALTGDAEVFLAFDALDLVEGTYKLDVAVHQRDGAPYDYHRLLYTFRVKSRTKDVGIYRPRHRWEFVGDVKIAAEGC